MNAKDPLNGAPSRELFMALSQVASGFSADQVIEASAVLLINALRQNCPTRDQARAKFDEIATKAGNVLLSEHYDALGKRRNVFPFNQTIQAMPLVNPNKIRGT